MSDTSIFVNIPTTDLERAKTFYTALGWTINPLFTDENAACVVVSDTIYFMIVTRDYLQTFTDKPIIDPATAAQTSLSFTRDSRDEVDETIAKGLAGGGSEPRPAQDLGFMYSRDLEDPDGNILGFLFMEQAAVENGPDAHLSEQGAAPAASA
ncbi:VOC family protein [Agromyces sp. MMS24-K17]|uniref:VOC family protein n=1 Tax=Agromyces sp. MMS24-K17 TaxID=3372850 RepID=UPI00375496A4